MSKRFITTDDGHISLQEALMTNQLTETEMFEQGARGSLQFLTWISTENLTFPNQLEISSLSLYMYKQTYNTIIARDRNHYVIEKTHFDYTILQPKQKHLVKVLSETLQYFYFNETETWAMAPRILSCCPNDQFCKELKSSCDQQCFLVWSALALSNKQRYCSYTPLLEKQEATEIAPSYSNYLSIHKKDLFVSKVDLERLNS